jgi:hypothetical protein
MLNISSKVSAMSFSSFFEGIIIEISGEIDLDKFIYLNCIIKEI